MRNLEFTMYRWVYNIPTCMEVLTQIATSVPRARHYPPWLEVQNICLRLNCGLIIILTMFVIVKEKYNFIHKKKSKEKRPRHEN